MSDQSPTPPAKPEASEPSMAEKVSAYAAHLEDTPAKNSLLAMQTRADLARELAVILFRAEELHRSKVAQREEAAQKP